MLKLIAAVPMLIASTAVLAQQGVPARNLPTLSEYGLYGLIALVGAAGAYIVRRKK